MKIGPGEACRPSGSSCPESRTTASTRASDRSSPASSRDSKDILLLGRRGPGGACVHVGGDPLAPGSALWETSLCLRDHSPTGPEWGYVGCGPAQLALAVLLLVTDSVEAERYYHIFKQSVIAGIRADRWTLPVRDVRTWLDHVRTGEPRMLIRTAVGADGTVAIVIGSQEERET